MHPKSNESGLCGRMHGKGTRNQAFSWVKEVGIYLVSIKSSIPSIDAMGIRSKPVNALPKKSVIKCGEVTHIFWRNTFPSIANPQPNTHNTNNNEISGQSGNISGNSTTRPPEGDEHDVAIETETTIATTNPTETAQLPRNSSKNNNNNNDDNRKSAEHLAEVLVMPVNDTKTAATITTTAEKETAETKMLATKSNTNTANDKNSWHVSGNVANEASSSSAEARPSGAIAPIAQEEEDTEEVWYSEEEAEELVLECRGSELPEKQLQSGCCLINANEQGSQADMKVNENAIITTNVNPPHTTTQEKPVQRSKSRMRTYLKKCRDRLTGQHQPAVTQTQAQAQAQTTTTNTTMHLQDEKTQESIALELHYAAPNNENSQLCFPVVEEAAEDEETEQSKLTTLNARAERRDDMAVHKLLTLTAMEADGVRERLVLEAQEEGEDEEEARSTSEQTELAYEDIDFSLPSSTLMDNSSGSNVSVDQRQQTTPLTSVAHKRDALTFTARVEVEVEVDDSGDLAVEQEQHVKLKCSVVSGETLQQQQQQQQQQHQQQQQQSLQVEKHEHLSFNSNCPPLVKEEQLACAVWMDSGTAALIDKHLAAIYTVFTACTRSILIRQARDLLVCSYLGCLQSFEMKFLCKFAEIAAELTQRHAIGEVRKGI
ncbi:unnamed protein product [Ceratitis capitata]|uniref:(Mediterranean fruit fly) hypothetical protein n=1 Tax=Ceratitis capitata TaxID=7213 RepID=A0A811UYM5_CERCA|nr:unnamed protein product [Ceratitis capitata]